MNHSENGAMQSGARQVGDVSTSTFLEGRLPILLLTGVVSGLPDSTSSVWCRADFLVVIPS